MAAQVCGMQSSIFARSEKKKIFMILNIPWVHRSFFIPKDSRNVYSKDVGGVETGKYWNIHLVEKKRIDNARILSFSGFSIFVFLNETFPLKKNVKKWPTVVEKFMQYLQSCLPRNKRCRFLKKRWESCEKWIETRGYDSDGAHLSVIFCPFV